MRLSTGFGIWYHHADDIKTWLLNPVWPSEVCQGSVLRDCAHLNGEELSLTHPVKTKLCVFGLHRSEIIPT